MLVETLETDTKTSPAEERWFDVSVCEAMRLTSDILHVRLISATNDSLPIHEPGAHVALKCGPDIVRHYSLTGPCEHEGLYDLAIKLSPTSQGGSSWVFDQVKVGSSLRISSPRNNFPLVQSDDPYLFLSGGIGITPIISMLYRLRRQNIRARLIHMCRTPEDLGFESWLSDLCGFHDVRLHYDSHDGQLDLDTVLGRREPNCQVYCCGPTGMMEVVRNYGAQVNALDRFHFEYFALAQAPEQADGDCEFTVIQKSTGRTIRVLKTKTMLASLREAGIEMKSECEYGVCGWCAVKVLEGTPAHFDSYLTNAEKEANELVLPCVSRCKSKSIVLDI
ncbi:PDR/VanB family oxidoreductase [Pusillimonas sp.]|uniref:PDR/VanB family oxidoreductase n=1 Tax=Pusillimonas sp. TaxID=3040095 RepID=UPI0037C89FCA